jgi:hypothetical protein
MWGRSGSINGRAIRARLLAEARLRHQRELKSAPFWRRLGLEFTLRQQVRTKMRRMFPADALYAFGDPR